jgi:hypothetical protein
MQTTCQHVTGKVTAMRKFLCITTIIITGACATALAAQNIRVRGEVTAVHDNTLDITTYSNRSVDLQLKPDTRYILVVPARLSDIRGHDFVGIGTTGPENHLVALEVVIFPESMRGTGEGHYPWSIDAAVAAADRHQASPPSAAPPVQGTMTNGTVIGTAAPPAAPPVQGTMTNGTVTATTASTSGGSELTVGYGKRGKVEILVPADAPVVRLQPAQRSDVKPGDKVFSVATTSPGAHPSASVVAVGQNGLMPPM